MDLPITLSQLGYGIIGFTLGIFTKVSYWLILETFEQRKMRHKWYSTVSRLAHEASDPWRQEGGFVVVQYHRKHELTNVESELKELQNPPFLVDRDIHERINQLATKIDKFSSSTYIRDLEEGGNGFAIDLDDPGHDKTMKLVELMGDITQTSSELAEDCETKLEEQFTIPIVNLKI